MTNQKLMLTTMILAGFIMTITPFAFAEQVSVSLPQGSSIPGCEETNECFLPYMVTVNPGDEVVWSNDDSAAHTVTSGAVPNADGLFDSGIFMAGTTFSHTFDTLGKYDYFCVVHPWMVGQVFVTVGGDTEKDLGTITIGTSIEPNHEVDNLIANIVSSEGNANEVMTIDVTITDLDGNPAEHITYNIQAIHGTIVLLNEEGHMHGGTVTNTHTTSALTIDASDDSPVTITVNAVGFGHDEQYREVFGEIAKKQVVPEFGTIAMMILAVSIVSIMAITAKTRIVPRF
ncbi:MAG: PEFG-CTERM sorting domain-containing protein [Nitrosopumilus sp.]|uniref:PEFG-CTERM sorting domain-containing protein n=1 Tax=Nitrosopumilus sp. TaxID=2024843 RepID=UPI00246FFDA0|nr:PEFG-CTERM sorting domain-containing protein [Nitrosopumilus sp.]MDH5431587.1 PEFG-CTERM sorting domain-containing protein [Nitrosopumilus sp.]MDH5665689.1 PEFG-CTERM sorting domain-containing protein [Nitrosopumilus sp.]